MPFRVRLAAAAIALVSLTTACETADSKFPVTGSFFGSVTVAKVNIDSSRTPAPREFRFRILDFHAEFPDQDSLSFIDDDRRPCTYVYSVASLFDPPAASQLTRQCGSGGLALEAGRTGTVSFVLELEAIVAVHAERPDLSTGFDADGDGVPNESDNCPIQPNPRVPVDPEDPDAGEWQPDVNGDGVGDACSFPVEGTTDAVVPDQDLDGVYDGTDNCLWYPNPADDEGVQADTNANGIGDACERTVPVFLNAGSRIVCPAFGSEAAVYEIPASGLAFFAIEFGEAIRCDPAFTGCDLDPSAVELRLHSGIPDTDPPATTEFACEALP